MLMQWPQLLCVPAPSSYSGATLSGLEYSSTPSVSTSTPQASSDGKVLELCPYASHGECWYGENCTYRHGELCDFCGKAKLDPLDEEQRKKHIEVRRQPHWMDSKDSTLGAESIKRCHLTSIGNPIVEIRRSYDRLISTMGFPILVRRHLYIESGPRSLNGYGRT